MGVWGYGSVGVTPEHRTQDAGEKACHCEADERAEAIPVAMKAMFLTAEDAEERRGRPGGGDTTVSIKATRALTTGFTG